MMNCGVYQIKNTVTGDFYIGSSCNIERRLSQHRRGLVNNRHGNIHLQRSWNKHGEDSFTFETILLCNAENLLDREQFYIDSEQPEYNICPTAGSSLGCKHSEEQNRKKSEAMTGKHLTEETRRKLSEAKTGKPNGRLGYKHTDETKRKNSAAAAGELNPMFGKPVSEEHRRKLSEAAKRYWVAKRELEAV